MSEYAAVLDHVRERTGLAFPPSRVGDGQAAVAATMCSSGVRDATSYLDRIRSDEKAFDVLIAALTVGETYFCRDADQFTALRDEILPEIALRRGADHMIRAWSAGCASGEEAYSLAIVFLEQRLRFSLIGSDISTQALAKARAASYGTWSLRGTGSAFRERYFRPEGDRFVLHDFVRHRVGFEPLNLIADDYPAQLDLILCRNVLIYFDAETSREVGRRLVHALAPGGWLLLGASDPMLDGIEGMERVMLATGVAYRRGAAGTPMLVVPRIAAAEPPPPPPHLFVEEEVLTPSAPAATAAAAEDVQAAIERLRKAADAGPSEQVLQLAGELIDRYPLAAELHLLHALLLFDLQRDDVAEAALRRALFLDPSLALAHFTLGMIVQRRGNAQAAARSFQNAIASARQTGEQETRVAAELALKAMSAEARS